MLFHVRFICDSFSLNKMKPSRGPVVSECEIQTFARYGNLQPWTKIENGRPGFLSKRQALHFRKRMEIQ